MPGTGSDLSGGTLPTTPWPPRPPSHCRGRLCPHPQGPKHPPPRSQQSTPTCSILAALPGEAASPSRTTPSFHTPGPLPHPHPSLSLPLEVSLQRPGPQPPSYCKPRRPAVSPAEPHALVSMTGWGGGQGASCCLTLPRGPRSPAGTIPLPRLCSFLHSTLVSACPEITCCLLSRTCLSPQDAGSPWGGSFPDLVQCYVQGPRLKSMLSGHLLKFHLQTVHTQLSLFRADPLQTQSSL